MPWHLHQFSALLGAATGGQLEPKSVEQSWRKFVMASTTAAVLQLAVIALVCTVINVDIILPFWSEWNERTRLLYTTGTTVLATIVTALIVGSIRKSWFNRISHAEPISSSSDKKGRAQMRALTGLAEWREQFTAWPVFVAFLIVGLATTVIVVALTPRATSTNDLGYLGHICTSTGGFCTNAFARRSTAGQLFSWTLPDGTLVGLDQNITNLRSFCSPRPAIDLLTTGIAQILPSDAACRQDGTVTVSDTNRTLTVSNGDCTVTSNALRVQPSTNAATVMGACTQNHDFGTATIMIGAVDEIFGFEGNGLVVKDGSYAQQLKNALDLAGLDGREFSATCTIDVPSAMGLRSLNYSCVERSESSKQFKYPGMLATAAGASWPLLVENSFDDGYFDTLMYLATLSSSLHGGDPVETRKGVFPGSLNDLEDTLGAVTAVTMGIEYLDCSSGTTLMERAPMSYSRTRLGPSNPLLCLYLLPSIISLAIVGWLFWSSLRLRRER
ncbi:hypothetical protein BKA64DRAFT_722338 [Cadophora sp. MPI-SDFR-AT-0126]|nr:hypothetical protein BKA64DRAFT_722338 [Leotiomycetes sp. MPI-SDFR-AT-0126]